MWGVVGAPKAPSPAAACAGCAAAFSPMLGSSRTAAHLLCEKLLEKVTAATIQKHLLPRP